ncbi:MAG: Cof-type HAD-IIB family hydrolase [Eubacteriales bacterium]|nr:Cof-type HAD-IIB family hydrolase [Eubacteriales bacterium]
MSKLIFLDIDGTLTEAGTNVPPESAVKAMEMARKNGNKVCLCTGRNMDMLSPLLVYPFDGIVSSSGGYVTVGDTVLADCPMPKEVLKQALDCLHSNGVFCTIEGNNGSFGDENLKDFLDTTEGGNSEIERWRKALSESLHIRPMNEYDGSPIYKIVVMAREASQIDECRALLGEEYNIVLQDMPAHGCVNGELLSKSFDKGKGVRQIAEHFGYAIEDTIGFGDSMNDIEMIETVGHAVCMANGSETLKKYADEICPAVTEDGLYKAFEKLGLLG